MIKKLLKYDINHFKKRHKKTDLNRINKITELGGKMLHNATN